jgi:hypothetical protein
MTFSKGPKNPFYLDDRPVIFPWFSGKETPMNRAGDRNFGVVLTPQQADELVKAGYNVKSRRPKGEDGQPDMSAPETLYLKCKINFNSNKPPRVVLVTCIDDVCKRTPMDDVNVALLDRQDIDHVDVKITPYDREASDTRTAYVQNLYVFVNLDKLDARHDNIPWDGSAADVLPHDSAPADAPLPDDD